MIKRAFQTFQDVASVRIPVTERLIRLQTSNGKWRERERLFTLHSASGIQQPDGAVELEEIAGYCHERRMLRTYRLRHVQVMIDAATGMEIADLADWIEASQVQAPALSGDDVGGAWPDARQARTGAPAGQGGRPQSAAEAIDDAVRCAWQNGDREIAERLFRIGGLLNDARRAKLSC